MAGYFGFGLWGPIGEIESVQGEVLLVRDGLQVQALPGMWVYSGDLLNSSQAAHWAMRYPDTSLLSGRGPGELTLSGNRWESKQINIANGDISADARRQPEGRPMQFTAPTGVATVVGTELHLLVDDAATRLDVEHGEVRLKNRFTDEARSVVTGKFATATEDALTSGTSAWPMNRAGLIVDSRFNRGAAALKYAYINARTKVRPRTFEHNGPY